MPDQPTTKPYSRLNDNLLESYSARWRLRNRAEGTLREYVRHLRGLERWFDDSFLNASRTELERYVDAEMQRTSPATAAYLTRALRSFYAWLAEEEEIDVNPAARLVTPKVPEPVTKVASKEDVVKMLATCRPGKMFASFNDRRALALIHVLRASAMRISEVAAIEPDFVDLIGHVIIVPKTKTGKVRVAPLDATAAKALGAYMRRIDVSCPGSIWRTEAGTPLALWGVKQVFERRAKRAGVDVSPHQLRRAFAGEYIRRGGSQTALQTLAGWSSPRMVDRYLGVARTEIALAEYQRLFATP